MIRQLKTWSALFLGLFFLTAAQAASVETRDIPSEAMHKAYPAVIAIPDAYAQNQDAYPVLYLLHGYSGSYKSWLRLANLGEFADRYGMIIVSLDGAYDSWYFDIPSDPACQFETYISKEVPAYIDHALRTVAAPRGRAIAGLSMGGHGAMYLSLRHKDVFGAAGSMSGGLDIRPFPDKWHIANHIGTLAEHPQEWEARTAINNIGDLKNGELAIAIDCGVGDFFIGVNRAFRQELLNRGIDHDYTERPGGHDGTYWANCIKYQVLFFHDFFAKGAAKAQATPAQ